MKGLPIVSSGSTVTVSGLPTDNSVQALAVTLQIMKNGKRHTIMWGDIDRTDPNSPDCEFDLITQLEPSTGANGAIKSDFDPAGFKATVFVRTVSNGKKCDFKDGSEAQIDVDAVTVSGLIAQHDSKIPASLPAANAKGGKGGKGNGPGGQGSGGNAGGGGQGGGNPPNPPQGGNGGGRGPGGNAGGGGHGGGHGPAQQAPFPPYPPSYPPHAPIVVSNPPPAPQPIDNGKFYSYMAIVAIVFGLVALLAWLAYTYEPKVRSITINTSSAQQTDFRPAAPAKFVGGTPTAAVAQRAPSGPKEINTVIGELPPLPAAKPVQTTIAQRVVAAPVYDSYGYNGSAVSSYGVSYHAGGSSTYAAPVTYSRQPPIDVTRVHTVRGSGHVLTSSPAFGISNDLVGAGNNYRVVANYRENRSGRRN